MINKFITFFFILIVNYAFCQDQEATIIFNDKLKQKLSLFFPNSPVHDYHVSLAGLFMGHVYHIPTPLMLYRRHDAATTKQNLSLRDRLNWFVNNKSFLYNRKMLNYLKDFVSYHQKQIKEKDWNLINDYFEILDDKISLISKIKLIKKNKFTLRNSSYYLIIKIILQK